LACSLERINRPIKVGLSEVSNDEEHNSLLCYYLENDNEQHSSVTNSQDESTQGTPSLCSDSCSDVESIDTSNDESVVSENTNEHDNADKVSQNGDKITKSFLQLKGIMVGNYNMGCNFHILNAIRIIIQYNLRILVVQEHTSWNRELTEHEVTSIKKHCDTWGYFVTISKLQIIITDKQLLACHCEVHTYKEGRITVSHFHIARKQFATFVATYGITHSGNDRRCTDPENAEENEVLQEMREVHEIVKMSILNANRNKDIIFVFGDLQDTPDNSRKFHYGKRRIPKHPLGIVMTCEDMGLSCAIYQHIDSLDKLIISRHGAKGGRFIDGMYACPQGLERVQGITIIKDTGVNSDYALIISNIELGIKKI
jgi:hypothetical protein